MAKWDLVVANVDPGHQNVEAIAHCRHENLLGGNQRTTVAVSTHTHTGTSRTLGLDTRDKYGTVSSLADSSHGLRFPGTADALRHLP